MQYSPPDSVWMDFVVHRVQNQSKPDLLGVPDEVGDVPICAPFTCILRMHAVSRKLFRCCSSFGPWTPRDQAFYEALDGLCGGFGWLG